MLIFADFRDNTVIKCTITGSNKLKMIIFIISQQIFWVNMVWLVKKSQKCQKNSKNRKKTPMMFTFLAMCQNIIGKY